MDINQFIKSLKNNVIYTEKIYILRNIYKKNYYIK